VLRRRFQSVLACALLAAATGMAITQQQAQADSNIDLAGNSVIRYQSKQTLVDTTRFVVQGKKNDHGCTFAAVVNIPSRSGRLAVNELAYDPEKCLSLLERGTPTAHDTGQRGDKSLEGSGVGGKTGSANVGTQSVAPPCTAFSGWCWYIGFHSWFEDPIAIHVNDVTNDISWPQDSTTCALPAGTSFGWGYRYQWYTPTGWTLEEHNETSPGDCNSVRSSSYAHFLNTPFCPDNTWTNVYYDRNTIIGYPGGFAQGQIGWDKNGACNGLLSYHYEYTFS
jgi:hypothetical protein